MNSTQTFQSFAELIDRGTLEGRRMISRKRRWIDRWHSCVELFAWITAFAMVAVVLGGCGWIMWEVCYGVWSLLTAIFN